MSNLKVLTTEIIRGNISDLQFKELMLNLLGDIPPPIEAILKSSHAVSYHERFNENKYEAEIITETDSAKFSWQLYTDIDAGEFPTITVSYTPKLYRVSFTESFIQSLEINT